MLLVRLSPRIIYWAKVFSQFLSVQVVIQFVGFASGILVIRTLGKEEYAYFTIANSMQSVINLLADMGISIALLSIGGKVWHDRYRFGQLINTAMELRKYLAIIAVLTITPLLFWMLITNGASIVYTVLIIALVLLEVNFRLTTGVLSIVPKLHSKINQIQKLDLYFSTSRLAILCVGYFTYLNGAISILASTIASGLQRFLLVFWIRDYVHRNASVSNQDRLAIVKIIKTQIPSTIYYCIQGQMTIWLISIFGSTQNIAEVGALSRLGLIISMISSAMDNIILPRFSRYQSFDILYRRYWQILIFFVSISIAFIFISAFFPEQILFVLGGKYTNLKNELLTLAISHSFNSFVGVLWSINASRAWIQYSWIYVPSTIAMQIFLLLLLDLSTVKGVIIFGGLSNLPFLMVNILLAYNGLKSVYRQKS